MLIHISRGFVTIHILATTMPLAVYQLNRSALRADEDAAHERKEAATLHHPRRLGSRLFPPTVFADGSHPACLYGALERLWHPVREGVVPQGVRCRSSCARAYRRFGGQRRQSGFLTFSGFQSSDLKKTRGLIGSVSFCLPATSI
jgi:hypothetical protein